MVLSEGTQCSHGALLDVLALAPDADPGAGLCSRALLGRIAAGRFIPWHWG